MLYQLSYSRAKGRCPLGAKVSAMADGAPLQRTPLYEEHLRAGARLVDFHGWELPLQYAGILAEHAAVRGACGAFDVSHMGQVELAGPGALPFLESVSSSALGALPVGRGAYSFLTDDRGGVIDDVIATRLGDERWLLVVNGATRDADLAWLRRHLPGDVQLVDRSAELAMVALQGPAAIATATQIAPAAAALPRFGAIETQLLGTTAIVSRTGYTGEDGVEILLPAAAAPGLWRTLLDAGATPCGLGARDVLRLEAGMLLCGEDMDATRTPVEAGATRWVKVEGRSFHGRDALARQIAEGTPELLQGVRLTERGIPRRGAVVRADGAVLGTLTSATWSPSLNAGIGIGYLRTPALAPGTAVSVEVHGRELAAEIARIPFFASPHRTKGA